MANNDSFSSVNKSDYCYGLNLAPYPHVIPIWSSNSTGTDDDLYVNQQLKNKKELVETIIKLAVLWKFEFMTCDSEKSKVILGCLDERCKWRMRATNLLSS